jgi:hypothetical protein
VALKALQQVAVKLVALPLGIIITSNRTSLRYQITGSALLYVVVL